MAGRRIRASLLLAAQDTRVPNSLLIRCAQPLPDRDPGPGVMFRQDERDRYRREQAWQFWWRQHYYYCQSHPRRCRDDFDRWYYRVHEHDYDRDRDRDRRPGWGERPYDRDRGPR